MTPELYETFLRKKDAILATGIDFINLAELHLNPTTSATTGAETSTCAAGDTYRPCGAGS